MGDTNRTLTYDAYTVGWVAVLRSELNACRLLLDEEHEQLQPKENDDNTYVLGRMGAHNIVITYPGAGTYGTTVAAQAVTNMVRTFPSVRFGLLVGVGGGAPRPPNSEDASKDIRLGDVVVSNPKGNHGGVLQHDMGKWKNDEEFSIESHLNKPPGVLLKAVKLLQSNHDLGRGKMSQYIQEAARASSEQKALKAYQFPGRGQDRLFKTGYQHAGGESCSGCSVEMTEKRLDRDSDEPVVHYGLVASANAVMRSAQRRDKLRDTWGVSCFEMEAAGLMDNFPCIVIRGICDYSDEHKSKSWQPYAVTAAAAYAKDLLGVIMPKEVTSIPPAEDAMKNIPENKAQPQAPHHGPTQNELLGKITQLEARNKYLEERNLDRASTVFGYAGFTHLGFLDQLSDANLRRLKHRIPQVLAELAKDVDWKNWHRIIDNLNSEFRLTLLSSDGEEYEGRSWTEWKRIHWSESHSDYVRTVAFRNRLGQWCNNNKHQGGCGLIWVTFVLQLYDVLQVYKPHVY